MQGTLPTSEARRRCSSPSLATLRHSSTSASPRSRRARIFSSCMSRPRNSDACSPRNSFMCCPGQCAESGPERNIQAMPLALQHRGKVLLGLQHLASKKCPALQHRGKVRGANTRPRSPVAHTCSYNWRTCSLASFPWLIVEARGASGLDTRDMTLLLPAAIALTPTPPPANCVLWPLIRVLECCVTDVEEFSLSSTVLPCA
jgi:hypothetical protein